MIRCWFQKNGYVLGGKPIFRCPGTGGIDDRRIKKEILIKVGATSNLKYVLKE